METKKRIRTQLRREFTSLENQLEKTEDDEDTTSLFALFEQIASKLFSVEDEVCELWCAAEDFNESQFIEDQAKAMTYKVRWHKIKTLFNKREQNSIDSLHVAESNIKNVKHRLPNLPVLNISKFDGNIKSWLQFWGQFEKIHNDSDIDSTDKFQYLLQSMAPNSSARQLIESYPPSGANYSKAVEALKSRFARDDMLIESYVRGLILLMNDKGEAKDLSSLFDSLQTHLQALETLGVAKDRYASMLLPMIESTLPDEVLRAWHRCQYSCRDLSNLMLFLQREVESEERIKLARGAINEMFVADPMPPTACFVTESKRVKDRTSAPSKPHTSCVWCEKENHSSTECHKAAKMSLKDRIDFLKSKKACLICLKINHLAKKCRSFPKCLFCKKRHFTIMCTDIGNHTDSKPEEPSSNLSCQSTSTTLLQTFVVKLIHGRKEILIRALIDSGSQRSYIRKDVIEKLDLIPTRKEAVSHCLFGGLETKKEERQVFNIFIQSVVNDFQMNLSVVEQNVICGVLPKIVSRRFLEQLRHMGILLTDSTDDSPNEIGLLIGADYSGTLLTGEFIDLENNLTAVRTKVGWTIQGPVTGVSSIVNMTTTLQSLIKVDISDLWSLESLGIRDPAEQISKIARDSEVLKMFEENITVNDDGRYEVCLPWKDVPRPQTNFELAKTRLRSTMNRLAQLGKVKDYDKVFREWLQLNIIEEAPDQSIRGHYIAHHAVVKESSLTTKIRPVFDASARDKTGISLNSCLEKGVNLLEQIPNLLINFRKNKIGVTADIAKAFLQISVDPDDRDYLRFLWWSKLEGEEGRQLTTYRHKRVVFGVKSSPFHLVATINHHLDNCAENLKETAMKLKGSFYVDNCVVSVETEEELNKFIKESKEVMLNGMFDLRGWISSPILVDEDIENTSVLGVIWNIKNDSLQCHVNFINPIEKLTKRTLLSVTQRVFDPIGIACPTTIVPKIIIQKSWCRKLTWDKELPDDLANEFKRWLDQAHFISNCTVPRPFTTSSLNDAEVSLHVFCDACKDAYSACIFIRSVVSQHVDVSLVLAKSRVTPVKKITIPRLELIAATLASRLSVTVIESLGSLNFTVYYWTDSSVVLTWIKSDGPWTVFVSNRVKEILSISSTSSWHHVPGHLNPADLPSRGVQPKGLVESHWWKGPTWLRLPKEEWPATEFCLNKSSVNVERRKSYICSMLVEQESFLSRLTYFSNYNKIVRMISWMLRLKRKSNSKELTYEEYEYAEEVLVKLIQQKYKNNLICNKKIQTFTDDKGIIRLSTKLSLGSEDKTFKFPILLPGEETIVRRLVERRHIELQHAGVQILLCSLRQTFWIVGQRKLVRSIISHCMKCKRFKAIQAQAPTGVLPIERMEASGAFQFSGVDLAGPLMLRSGLKAWIVLFTCATYRAVHLEVVESLSTGEFLMALRRFVARRGRVECLFSDNATNFRGLDNAFASLDWDEIHRFSSITRIKWNFLPPAAPWWGGFYERLIGFLKQILRRVLGRAAVSLMELQTVLCDCEAVINSRPLTYLGSLEELQPLTPSMFIQPLPFQQVTDFDQVDGNTLNIRQRYCQKLRVALRKRFRDEYIGSLIQKPKRIRQEPLQIGDIVLLEVENAKRVTWPLAIVEDIYEGADNVGRVVRVRTCGGTKIRPVQRLFPLELRVNKDDKLLTGDLVSNNIRSRTESQTRTAYNDIKTRSGRLVRVPGHLFDYDL